MESFAPPQAARGALSASNAPQSLASLTLGSDVVVSGGKLDGLKGNLIAIQEGRRCTVRLFQNVQLVISLDRLTSDSK
jgi:hypothetical protein